MKERKLKSKSDDRKHYREKIFVHLFSKLLNT